ncbi:tyrosine protein kinase, putative [Entamoeba invadens IP1]|uniref:Tyrosine protein kinase, putative n=1 Tax=Entamoeba invadens IP1 TaxID=370355 RepID=A0A0A1U6Y0_ENTIV|nr:tyrosine protein kinase, putative [Entamoeba invadens IP1]ELP90080.1 tyrosine protein kinase, putative [Entamoeba invadens IP1]|eukprot:XP_004256851.1 tyrosine protein kinase, putative [Entamoeba invadens IP1]
MRLSNEVALSVFNIEEDKRVVKTLTLSATTKLTTRLDPDELILNAESIGEGSFAVVYLGLFRGNAVAVKKMKDIANPQQIADFEKEIVMMDKFRSEYIIHFYGAVFFTNNVSVVTEYAEYGSFANLRKKDNEKNVISVSMKIRIKILKDASRGIQYLHTNGILHRDVKPDNILVVSLKDDQVINGKLADFGSARNTNMMMTNMTFTKGIGTPKYMAPEVLEGLKHYNKPADIYSFGITMYEGITWRDPYPKENFKFAWCIAEYVDKGGRPERVECLTNEMYGIINETWDQDKQKRIKIDVLVEKLETLYTTI